MSFKGHVESLAAATGSRFSLLPPENATGNFVKVVQRVPVRIAIDEKQDAQQLLRPGMSVTAKVYTQLQADLTVRLCPMVMIEHRHVNPWIVAIAVMFGTFMEVLDTTVVNVSLPHIAATMSATIDEATWVLTSYLVANAIILPMTGWLAATFGRKRLLMMSVTGFTVSSFLCGIAPNLGSLIAFRILQGATGGALQPLSQAVLLESFEPHERGKAMGFWGLGIVVAPILGPVVGGWLTDTYSWRWVFYINLPVGIASIIMTKHVHLRPAVPAPRRRARSTTGASACSSSASARCSTCSTRDRKTTGSRRPSILILSIVVGA